MFKHNNKKNNNNNHVAAPTRPCSSQYHAFCWTIASTHRPGRMLLLLYVIDFISAIWHIHIAIGFHMTFVISVFTHQQLRRPNFSSLFFCSQRKTWRCFLRFSSTFFEEANFSSSSNFRQSFWRHRRAFILVNSWLQQCVKYDWIRIGFLFIVD